MRKGVMTVWLLLLLMQGVGCVVGDEVRKIRPEDTNWIQQGQTTREQVMARFGKPHFTGAHKGVGKYDEYHYSHEAPVNLEPVPDGAFPLNFPPPSHSTSQVQSPSERFWIMYDSQGVVQDYGFGAPPP